MVLYRIYNYCHLLGLFWNFGDNNSKGDCFATLAMTIRLALRARLTGRAGRLTGLQGGPPVIARRHDEAI